MYRSNAGREKVIVYMSMSIYIIILIQCVLVVQWAHVYIYVPYMHHMNMIYTHMCIPLSTIYSWRIPIKITLYSLAHACIYQTPSDDGDNDDDDDSGREWEQWKEGEFERTTIIIITMITQKHTNSPSEWRKMCDRSSANSSKQRNECMPKIKYTHTHCLFFLHFSSACNFSVIANDSNSFFFLAFASMASDEYLLLAWKHLHNSNFTSTKFYLATRAFFRKQDM